MSKKPEDKPAIASIGPTCEHGHAPFVRYTEDGNVKDIGILMPAKDGQPMPPGSELIRATRREDGLHDMRTLAKGPAKVTTPAYRTGWDRIFGGKQEVGQA